MHGVDQIYECFTLLRLFPDKLYQLFVRFKTENVDLVDNIDGENVHKRLTFNYYPFQIDLINKLWNVLVSQNLVNFDQSQNWMEMILF